MADEQQSGIVGKVVVGSLIALGLFALIIDLLSGSGDDSNGEMIVIASTPVTNYAVGDDCIFPPEMDIELPNNQVRWADINIESARNLAYPGWEQPEVWGILKPEQQGFQKNCNIL